MIFNDSGLARRELIVWIIDALLLDMVQKKKFITRADQLVRFLFPDKKKMRFIILNVMMLKKR